MICLLRLCGVMCFALMMTGAALAAPAAVSFNEKITGVVQKPVIDIIFSRQNLTPKYTLVLDRSFLPKILDSVNQKPF